MTTYGANSCILETSEVGPRRKERSRNANTKDAEKMAKNKSGKGEGKGGKRSDKKDREEPEGEEIEVRKKAGKERIKHKNANTRNEQSGRPAKVADYGKSTKKEKTNKDRPTNRTRKGHKDARTQL